MKIKKRSIQGNMLILVVLVACFILIPLCLLQSQIGLFMVNNNRVESVVDGACLVAANQLSKIVIDDSHFGYVSLSNYPPIGSGTIAPDGEPLPVTGINTLVGTIRQNTIIAHELENKTMTSSVEKDRRYMFSTIKKLNFALSDSLKKKKKKRWKDLNGNEIDPYASAVSYLKENLPENVHIKSVKFKSGWLSKGGGSTQITYPQPERYAYVKPEHVQGAHYKPFVKIPAFGKFFTFAGLSESSRLVPKSRFKLADKRHICSIVKLECVIERKKQAQIGFKLKSKIKYASCSQPFSIPDRGPRGVMTLRFTGIPASGLTSWTDFLKEQTFSDNKVSMFKSMHGDYPVDPRARMLRLRKRASLSTSQHFAQSLYYWLRNGKLQPKVDSVIAMTNEHIKLNPKEIRVYEFADDGTISKRTIPKTPFQLGVLSDSQQSVVADTKIQGGLSPIIIIRNNVKSLGTKYGGKHGGQPLAGTPINWCELQEYGGDPFQAHKLGKGRLASGLTVANSNYTTSNGSVFNMVNGKSLAVQPRKTFYSGGLAVDIEIGGTTRPNIRRDVLTMRKLSR